MNCKAVIFDLDGTLLDSLSDIASAVNAVLASLGYPEHATQRYNYFVGDGMDTLIRRVIPEDVCDESLVTQLIPKIKAAYNERWNHTTRPYEGIPELLNALSAQDVALSVLSNKPHEFTRKMVEVLLSPWLFELVYGHRKGVPKKPDPQAAIEIIERLNVPREHIVFLGDTGIDMKTARSVGVFAVGVLWGFRDEQELLDNGAQVLIDHPMELLTKIQINAGG